MREIDQDVIARLEYGQRVVFSTRPADRQYPISKDPEPILVKLISEQDVFAKGFLGSPKAFGERPPNPGVSGVPLQPFERTPRVFVFSVTRDRIMEFNVHAEASDDTGTRLAWLNVDLFRLMGKRMELDPLRSQVAIEQNQTSTLNSRYRA